MRRKKTSARRQHRVVNLLSGNVPKAVVDTCAEGAESRVGITVQFDAKKRQRKRTGTE